MSQRQRSAALVARHLRLLRLAHNDHRYDSCRGDSPRHQNVMILLIQSVVANCVQVAVLKIRAASSCSDDVDHSNCFVAAGRRWSGCNRPGRLINDSWRSASSGSNNHRSSRRAAVAAPLAEQLGLTAQLLNSRHLADTWQTLDRHLAESCSRCSKMSVAPLPAAVDSFKLSRDRFGAAVAVGLVALLNPILVVSQLHS